MADVKTIDIDGIQWNLKDQEARDRINDIENKTVNLPIGVAQFNQTIEPTDWKPSIGGLYYYESKKYSEILPSGTKPIAISFGNWNIMAPYLITPYLGLQNIGFMSNSNNAKVGSVIIYVIYVKE